ncbi:MAG: putative transposase orfB for insertion sequence element [Gemmatimonadetes bacterium]|nr:putative transposase orfB for insertion sequence element [Gemmatimonadota bacterium]
MRSSTWLSHLRSLQLVLERVILCVVGVGAGVMLAKFAIPGVTCSMSRSGNVSDNAVMWSFFVTMKIQRCHRTTYATRNNARADVFAYIKRLLQSRPATLLAREQVQTTCASLGAIQASSPIG